MVKVLDARTVNGYFWFFYGALSDVQYTLTVTDVTTGERRFYDNPAGNLCGLGDTRAFPLGGPASPLAAGGNGAMAGTDALFAWPSMRAPSMPAPPARHRSSRSRTTAAAGTCAADAQHLCLFDDRFRVSVTWHDQHNGGNGVGTAVPFVDRTGFFWFFNPANVELVVKVLDAQTVNGYFWVFYGALSDVEYTITVTDTESGFVRTYHNEPGQICGRGDTAAFPERRRKPRPSRRSTPAGGGAARRRRRGRSAPVECAAVSSPRRRVRLGRVASAGVGLFVLAAAVRVTGELWAASLGGAFPQWDAAKYGVAGVRLAAALREPDPAAFAGGVIRLSLWPLFPLIEAPVLLVLGDDYRRAEGVVAALFLLAALAAFWAGRWTLAATVPPPGGDDAPDGAGRAGGDGRFGAPLPELAGALTAACVLTSPAFHLFGTLVMLEVPGTLLMLVAAGAYLRSLAAGRGHGAGSAQGFRLACAAAAALFFLKHNYGLLWLAPLGLSELWRASGEEGPLRRAVRWARQRWLAIDPRRPWTWLLAAYFALLASMAVTGGWELRLGGSTLHLHGLGNPVYALFLLVLARHLAWPRRRRVLVDRLRRLGRGPASPRGGWPSPSPSGFWSRATSRTSSSSSRIALRGCPSGAWRTSPSTPALSSPTSLPTRRSGWRFCSSPPPPASLFAGWGRPGGRWPWPSGWGRRPSSSTLTRSPGSCFRWRH